MILIFGKKKKKEPDIREMERRIGALEKQLDDEVNELKQRTREQVREIGESFRTLKDVMKKIDSEKNELEKDRNFLIEKHKDLLRQLPVDRSRLKRDIREKLLMPLHRQVKENAELIRDAAMEGIQTEKNPDGEATDDYLKSIKTAVVGDETKTPIDELFEMVVKQSPVRISDAARKFGVTDVQIEEWAKILEGHGLVEMHYPPIGKPELRKKQDD